MFCKLVDSRKYAPYFLVAGMVSLVFGVVGYQNQIMESHSGNMLLGMFSGFGGALVVASIVNLLRYKFSSAERLKEEEINAKDERNLLILKTSFSYTYGVSTVLLGVMAFVFVGLGYPVPSFIVVGAIWVQVIAFFLIHTYLNKKM